MKVPISRFTINGNSMVPTLKPGQDVLTLNWFIKPKRGDIVIVKKDGKEMVKRVQSVHDREVFVEGDNVDKSTDSRHFGPVKMDQIVGKVIRQLADHPERLAKDL